MKKNLKKLKLRKYQIAHLNDNSLKQIRGGWDDTPTIRDNCDFPPPTNLMCTAQNTWCICNPGDWCGYNHETDCNGPLLTVYGG